MPELLRIIVILAVIIIVGYVGYDWIGKLPVEPPPVKSIVLIVWIIIFLFILVWFLGTLIPIW